MIVDVMIEDASGNPADIGVLERWTEAFDLSIPVLADPGAEYLWSFAEGQSSVGLPFTVLIDRGMVIVDSNYPSTELAVDLL